MLFICTVNAIMINNGTFSWGTTDDDLKILKKYVKLFFYILSLITNFCYLQSG